MTDKVDGVLLALSVLVILTAAVYGVEAVAPLPRWVLPFMFGVDVALVTLYVARVLILAAVAALRGH